MEIDSTNDTMTKEIKAYLCLLVTCWALFHGQFWIKKFHPLQTFLLPSTGLRPFYPQGHLLTDAKRWETYKLSEEGDALELLLGYTVGDYRFLSKKTKTIHQDFFLNHLFTPSAFHLTCFLLFLSPLFRLISLFNPKIVDILQIFFSILLWRWDLFEDALALKRICVMKIIILGTNLWGKKCTSFVAFLLAFAIDLLFGSFLISPLSFVYSLLFYGTILLFQKKQWWKISLMLFISHLFVLYWQCRLISLPYFLMGQFFTFVVGLFFPITAILYWTPFKWAQKFALKIYEIFLQLITVCHEKIKLFPEVAKGFYSAGTLLLILTLLLATYLIIQKFSRGSQHVVNLR